MGLVSKWASEESLVDKAVSQDKKKGKGSNNSSVLSSKVTSSNSTPRKKASLTESRWATSDAPEEPVKESITPNQPSSEKSTPLKSLKESTVRKKRSNHQKKPHNDLAARIGVNSSHKKVTISSSEDEKNLNEESAGEESYVTSEESEEEISGDLKDLSLDAQDFAARLGLMPKSATSKPAAMGKKDNKHPVNKSKEKRSSKKDVTNFINHSRGNPSRSNPRKAPNAAAVPTEALKKEPSINFDKMFADFSKGQGLDWADDDGDDAWDISKFKN